MTAWLAASAPADIATCVIHNDFRFDNVVLDRADPTRVIGVLDWEMATIGDPLMDLGSALAYWIEAGDDLVARATRRQPTHLPRDAGPVGGHRLPAWLGAPGGGSGVAREAQDGDDRKACLDP